MSVIFGKAKHCLFVKIYQDESQKREVNLKKVVTYYSDFVQRQHVFLELLCNIFFLIENAIQFT